LIEPDHVGGEIDGGEQMSRLELFAVSTRRQRWFLGGIVRSRPVGAQGLDDALFVWNTWLATTGATSTAARKG